MQKVEATMGWATLLLSFSPWWLLSTSTLGLMAGTTPPPSRRPATVALWSTPPSVAATALSESFQGATVDATIAVARAADEGKTLLRVEFDTSMGDETYTTLKNSLEFARCVASGLAQKFEKLCVFFPDAGAAASAADQWKVGTNESLLPANVRLAAFPRDTPQNEEDAYFVVCPKASEAQATERLVDDVARGSGKPAILLNPELVDMGTTGYGYAGRGLRKRLLDGFTQAYYLKTLPWGALALTYPAGYSVYQESDDVPGGYKLLVVRDTLPNSDDLEDIFLEYNPTLLNETDDADVLAKLASGFARFADAFSKL